MSSSTNVVADVVLLIDDVESRVGWLEYFEEEETYRFEFDPDYLRQPGRPTLGQEFEDRLPRGFENAGMPLWFRALLPQPPVRRWIEQAHGLEELDDFGLLLALGDGDLPGAVHVRPSGVDTSVRRPPPKANHPVVPPDELRFSLAGVQWKFSVRDGERGGVIPVRGARGEWIAKLQDPRHYDLPVVEHATLMWAERCGLVVAQSKLVEFSEIDPVPSGAPTSPGLILLSRRFDRAPVRHIEDFSQIFGRAKPYRGHYEELVAVASYILNDDLQRMIQQIAFCVLCGNGDAHLKNWSVVYEEGCFPQLSPAYDLVSTVVFGYERLALELGGSQDFRLDQSVTESLATACDQDPSEVADWIHEIAARADDAWYEIDELYPSEYRSVVRAHLDKVLATLS